MNRAVSLAVRRAARGVFIVVLLLSLVCAGLVHAQSATQASRTTEEQKTIDVYKRANQAVVFITTRVYVVDPFAFFNEVRPQEGTGTGTIIDADKGLVITNLHVIENVLESGGSVEIMLSTGHNSKARLLGYDPDSDIALFKLLDPPKNLVGLPMGDSSGLEVGQRVLAIGNPFGLYRSLTTGIISSLDRSMKTPRGAVLKELIQTDAAINPGNSGGPLLDSDGRLIGINTAILTQGGGSEGIGFAVPINNIKRILPELATNGKVRKPRMGWQLVDTDQGPMVLRIAEGSAADEGGFQPIERLVGGDAFVRGYRQNIDGADLVYKVNGQRVRNRDEVEDEIRRVGRDNEVRFTVRRGGLHGKEREISIVPDWQ